LLPTTYLQASKILHDRRTELIVLLVLRNEVLSFPEIKHGYGVSNKQNIPRRIKINMFISEFSVEDRLVPLSSDEARFSTDMKESRDLVRCLEDLYSI